MRALHAMPVGVCEVLWWVCATEIPASAHKTHGGERGFYYSIILVVGIVC